MKTVKVVTGTGSSGTTFFIQLLAALGLTKLTGPYNDKVKGGYEWIVNDGSYVKLQQTPTIFKDPRLFFNGFEDAQQRLLNSNIAIDFVWLCFRDLSIASESRIKRGVIFHKYRGLAGVGSDDYEKQLDFFRKGLSSTIHFLCKSDIPFVLVDYERLGDPKYCEQCLQQAGYNLPYALIEEKHRATYQTDYKDRYKRL